MNPSGGTRDEPIEVLGKWWLPETPDRKVNGVLTFTEEDGARLQLNDALRPNAEVVWDNTQPDGTRVGHVTSQSLQHAGTYPRIVGRADNVSYTLEDCFRTRLRGSLGFGDAAETVHVNAVLRGIEFEADEAFEFTSATVSLTQLTAWSGINGITVEHHRVAPGANDSPTPFVTVTASTVPTLEIPFDGGSVRLLHRMSASPQIPNVMTITQQARVQVTFDGEELRPLPDFVARVNDVQDLVTIATGTTAAKHHFQLTHPDTGGPPADYFVRWNNRATTDKYLHSTEMLFTLADLGTDGLAAWLKTATTFQSELRRITATKYQPSMFLEDRATNLMAVLDSLTRHGKKKPGYFGTRITAAIQEVGEPFLTLIGGDVAGWTEHAKQRRNDLAHHNAGVLETSSSSVQLTREMYWLTVLLLLRRAGAPTAVFDKIGRSSEFTFLAEQHAAQRAAGPPS